MGKSKIDLASRGTASARVKTDGDYQNIMVIIVLDMQKIETRSQLRGKSEGLRGLRMRSEISTISPAAAL